MGALSAVNVQRSAPGTYLLCYIIVYLCCIGLAGPATVSQTDKVMSIPEELGRRKMAIAQEAWG